MKSLTVALAIIATLQATPALASGKEGAGIAEAVAWIVYAVLIALAVCTAVGVVHGGYRAHQREEPILKGVGKGAVKGIIACLVLGVVTMIVVTVGGFVFIIYAVSTGGGATPSSSEVRPATPRIAEARSSRDPSTSFPRPPTARDTPQSPPSA